MQAAAVHAQHRPCRQCRARCSAARAQSEHRTDRSVQAPCAQAGARMGCSPGVRASVVTSSRCPTPAGVRMPVSKKTFSFLSAQDPPTLVLFSKPDIYDSQNVVNNYLSVNKYQVVETFPAFTAWRPSKPDQRLTKPDQRLTKPDQRLKRPGQFGSWSPIGGEQTASGYVVAWKVTGADQYEWGTESRPVRFMNLEGSVRSPGRTGPEHGS